MLRTYPRICPFCESSCGLSVTADAEEGRVVRIAGDPDHPLSKGFLCPKSQGLVSLRSDPDRLQMPLLRVGEQFHEIGWDEAYDRAAKGLRGVLERHGPQSVGVYGGNPTAHVVGIQLGLGALLGAMPSLFVNSGSIDCYPRFLVDAYLYGNVGHVPVPDIERTGFFLVFGGNPMVSNGSMMGASNMPERLKRLRGRGGRLVVVDPRRSETAKVADDHFAIQPGTDALFALAMIATLFAEGLVRPGRLAGAISGLDELRAIAARFPAERVEEAVRVPAERIRQLARDLAAAEAAAVYGRVGANCQAFGTLAIWAIDCLNVLTGNLDREGGVLFPSGMLPQFMNMPWVGDQPPHGRWRSRVSGTAELGGTMASQVLWEEIETPGRGQIRGLVAIAGNPVVSNANAERVRAALGGLEFMVAVDIYRNETTRFADLILPPMDHLKRPEFSLIWNNWAVEDAASYSPAVFPREAEDQDDWDVLINLAARMAGEPVAAFERDHAARYVEGLRPALPRLPEGLSGAEALARASGETWPERIYDVMLRGGAAGDGFGACEGLSLSALKASGAGISLGAHKGGRFPAGIDTPDGKVALAAPIFVGDVDRLEQALEEGRFTPDFVLINRRHLRSNNSWMHNLHALTKGPFRCTALIHPDDAGRLGVSDEDMVRIRSRVGEIAVPAKLSDEVRPGVVSVPHGWGQADPAAALGIAHSYGGANVNVLSDDAAYDAPSGGACFNGTPVTVEKVA